MTINHNRSILPCMNYKQLQEFRQQVYELLNFAADATFELMDAVLTTRNVYSLAEFSLSPFFRRKWPSIYEALQDCRPNRNKLMRLYIKQMPGSVNSITFTGDWYTGCRSQTPWKVSGLASREQTY